MSQHTTRISPLLQQLLKNELTVVNKFRLGEVVDAVLIKKSAGRAYFDLGTFGTGIVYGVEFSNAKDMVKSLSLGEAIPAKIEALHGEGGYVELSLTEAGKQQLWQQVKELHESGEVVAVKIVGANSGGLLADIVGLKGFIPASQLSNEHYPQVPDGDKQKILEALKQYVGEEFQVKVLNVNPRTNKLILSERETLSANVAELLTNYTVGQVVKGVVSGVADFGVFVKFTDNPEIEGLVHISEIDHRLVDNPKEMVSVDEEVDVKIIDIKEGKVFLSMKALKENPWDTVRDHYSEGQVVEGKVYMFNPFGAIIALKDGIQGMIHVSEFGGTEEMKAALRKDASHTFVIDTIKPEEKRLLLKLKK